MQSKLRITFPLFFFDIFCSNSVLLFVVSPLLCAIRICHLAHWSAALTSARPSEDPSLRGCEWGDQTPPRWILAIGSCSCKLTALIRSIATAMSSRSVARIAGKDSDTSERGYVLPPPHNPHGSLVIRCWRKKKATALELVNSSSRRQQWDWCVFFAAMFSGGSVLGRHSVLGGREQCWSSALWIGKQPINHVFFFLTCSSR